MKFTNHHVSDLVIRLKNATIRKHSSVLLPNIKIVKSVLNLLLDQGYINEVIESNNNIQVNLKYIKGNSVIKEIQVVSKPSNRVYKKTIDMPSFYNGLGISVISTSKGIVTDAFAREMNVGGEVLCQVF